MSEYVTEILEELCEASDNVVYASLRGIGDDEAIANSNFSDCWDNAVEKIDAKIKQAKREAAEKILELHKQDRAKVNSQCDTLINISTVEKYLEGLE